MARPRSSAAAMTSASLTDPPGCTTAVAPARQARRGRRGTGKRRRTRPRCPAATGRRLHHGDLHRVDTAHLSGAHRERAIRASKDNRVGLHVRADTPREPKRLPFIGRRLPLRDDPDSSSGSGALKPLRTAGRRPASLASVTRSGSWFNIPPRKVRDILPSASRRDPSPLRFAINEIGGHHAHVLLLRQNLLRLRVNDGAMTASMKVAVERFRGLAVEGTVQADDAAESGQRIGVARADVGVGQVRARGRPARVGVLDHRRRRLGEFERNARAASRSSRFVNESSLPWCASHVSASGRPLDPEAFWCGFSP